MLGQERIAGVGSSFLRGWHRTTGDPPLEGNRLRHAAYRDPFSRQMSATLRPVSAAFNTPMICASVDRLIRVPSSVGPGDSHSDWIGLAGCQQRRVRPPLDLWHRPAPWN